VPFPHPTWAECVKTDAPGCGHCRQGINHGIYHLLFNGGTGDIKAIGRGPTKTP
jgi:hypothetical protein